MGTIYWKFVKKNIAFLVLFLIVFSSQLIILEPHLQYGFSDVDWGFLSRYKMQNPYTLEQLYKNFKAGSTEGGVYTHQIYYIGVQEHFFGLNYQAYQTTTHVFKILATIGAFPLFLIISGSVLIAFVSTIFFAFSYSAVGAMYTVVTSNDYLAIFVMEIFLFTYWYVLRKRKTSLYWLTGISILLLLTIFWSTERVYPLPFFIFILEAFLFKKAELAKVRLESVKRVIALLGPLLLVFLVSPVVFLDFLFRGSSEILTRVGAGNWNILLTPLIALGSIILPSDYAKYLGAGGFGPWAFFILMTLVIAVAGFTRPLKFFANTLIVVFPVTMLVFILGSRFNDHLLGSASISQALMGGYILAIAFSSFKQWLQDKDQIFLGLFVVPGIAFVYIFLTWLGAATTDVFSGAHRYLTIPAMGISLFLGTLIGVMIKKVLFQIEKISSTGMVIFVPLILFIFLIKINTTEVQSFFTYQLLNGFGAADKQYMRGQLNTYLDDLSSDGPSLFFFDFREDNKRGYYYNNALLAGFDSWMLWHPRIKFNKDLAPFTNWNQPEILAKSITERDGVRGFLYNNKFYTPDRFYAFKLYNKKVINITDTALKQLGFP